MKTRNPVVAALALILSLFVVVCFIGGLAIATFQTVGLAPFLFALSWALTPGNDNRGVESLLQLDKRISRTGLVSILVFAPNAIAITLTTGIAWWVAFVGFVLVGYVIGCCVIAKIGIEKRLELNKNVKLKSTAIGG